jgi:hypothetical protein
MSNSPQLKRVTVWAKTLGISRDVILRAIALGHLHGKRLGIGPTSPWYAEQDAIDQWLHSRTVRRRAW